MLNKKTAPYCILIAVIIGALVLRAWNLQQSFWWDELWSTLTYARTHSVWYMVSNLGYYFNNHILYSLLCSVFIFIFGESEITARLPALLLGVAAVPVLFSFCKDLTGTATALAVSYLLAVSAFHIDHSTEARGYSGLMLFALLSSISFISALRTDKRSQWVLFVLYTFLGFYFHVFMVAVSCAQFCCALVLQCGVLFKVGAIPKTSTQALKHFYLSMSAAAVITFIAYLPVFGTFLQNMGKVRLVSVDRMPFIMDLLNTLLPGLTSLTGAVVYGPLLLIGAAVLWKKDRSLTGGLVFLFFIILLFVPFALYILSNPMFVFERYFIYALPVCLIFVGAGITGLAECLPFSAKIKYVYIIGLLCAVTLLQAQSIQNITTVDRQNYREAVRFAEQRITAPDSAYLFSIGFAGTHFNYYADRPVHIPDTYAEFLAALDGNDEAWCLLTAWLPMLRPPHEDVELYAEQPEHEKIYAHVLKHFTVQKKFDTKLKTVVYSLNKKERL